MLWVLVSRHLLMQVSRQVVLTTQVSSVAVAEWLPLGAAPVTVMAVLSGALAVAVKVRVALEFVARPREAWSTLRRSGTACSQ
jgi:hypothetical protein